MLPAEEGDCFLISCGAGEEKVNILIDGGRSNTYTEQLFPILSNMHKKGEKIDLLIVTHIDQDHIQGIIRLLEKNESSSMPVVISISQIWHNAYLQLQFDRSEELTEHQIQIVEEIVARGDGERDQARHEISYRQGSTLGALLYEGGYQWNVASHGRAISRENLESFCLSDEVKIDLISPTNRKLEELAEEWLKHLENQNYMGKPGSGTLFNDAYEMMLLREKDKKKRRKTAILCRIEEWEDYLQEKIYEDKSAANGSSIAFVLTFKEKRILYLGDAHPSVIVENLDKLYKDHETQPYYFDAIKIAHHGSAGNTTSSLIERMESPIYLISTNGKNEHPDLNTLIRIVERKSASRELVFNYSTPPRFI